MRVSVHLPALPARPRDGHKGTFGTVVVVGGSPTMLGAPCLAAAGALRAGCGLVRLAVSAALLPFCLVAEPSATGLALGEDAERTLPAGLAADDVVAVGPGWGGGAGPERLLAVLLAAPQRLVIDADGLNALARIGVRAGRPREAAMVLTPHPGEFRRLADVFAIPGDPLDPIQRPAAAQALARCLGAVVVLKGRGSVVADAGRVQVIATGGPALAIAGSGDVLTGVIAALIAQGLDGFAAAWLGAHLHGLAGDLWTRRCGPSGLTARDLAGLIPEACQHHRRARRRRPAPATPGR